MSTCHLSLPLDVLNRPNPATPMMQWLHMSMPTTNVSKQKSKKKQPMVLVETWFEPEGGKGGKGGKGGWSPALSSGRPIPFFPTPPELNQSGMLWIKPEECYDLRNVETFGFTQGTFISSSALGHFLFAINFFLSSFFFLQDPFVKITMLCGNDKTPAGVVESTVAYDKGKKASWSTQAPLSLSYTAQMGAQAIAAGSTPYLLIEVWDKNSMTSNRLVGRVELPVLPLLQSEACVYARTLVLMDEDQVVGIHLFQLFQYSTKTTTSCYSGTIYIDFFFFFVNFFFFFFLLHREFVVNWIANCNFCQTRGWFRLMCRQRKLHRHWVVI